MLIFHLKTILASLCKKFSKKFNFSRNRQNPGIGKSQFLESGEIMKFPSRSATKKLENAQKMSFFKKNRKIQVFGEIFSDNESDDHLWISSISDGFC